MGDPSFMKHLNEKELRELVLGRACEDISKCNTANAAVIVAQGGRILLDERRGYKNFDTGEILSGGEMFRLASMTKPVAGVAFMKAVELGYFAPDDLLSDYLPEVGKMKLGRLDGDKVIPTEAPKNAIKMYHLLSHQSGFMASSPIETAQYALYPKEAHKSIETMVNYTVNNTCLTFEPSSAVGYATSLPFDAMALIIERKSGISYGEFLDKYIFSPLGIKDITFHPTEEQWERCVMMHDRALGPGLVTVNMGRNIFERHPLSYEAAGAGLMGSIEDYFVFAEMLRCRSRYRGAEIVSENTFSLIEKPYVTKEIMPGTSLWGLGVRVTAGDPYLPDGAYGWSGAYGTHFWVDPTNDITAVYMRNMRWYDTHGCGSIGREFERLVMSSFEE